MEILIFLFLCLVVLAVVVWNSHRDKGRSNRRIPPKFRPNPQYRKSVKRKVFDAQSATPLVLPQILEGYARITDGDSLVINKTQVRLYGIDAPELNHPYGQKAKWALIHMCKGQKIRAEVTEIDRYGRTVALCYLEDGRDISAEMVKTGNAIDWPKFSGGVYHKLEPKGVRRKLWLADARQNGRMHIWEQFEARQKVKEAAE
ncbi:thermonuclease family protein [Amylibacter sp. IMCC11727]|uniref:thermonuclease family protein n=1 Tax=Amylibacter sp. IMCC11727 TaxID=3039851 RepID=UPI00244DBC43|nr:thermonuclease family protein [Amylibacter sp. IMCC11727]WGI20882.1 thermonuclease family protein [Amylibacter sp. IMCC11727]